MSLSRTSSGTLFGNLTLALTALALPFVVACGDDSATTGGGGQGAGSEGGGPPTDGVCILHNCTENGHCAGCADGRNQCRVEGGSGSCVECLDSSQCPAEAPNCSPAGICTDKECPTDAMGNPTISCSNSGDCEGCDGAHLVCDTATQQCVQCTETDTAECQSTEKCVDNKCEAKCPTDCTVDNDCGDCGAAKACNNHKCSQCSETYACSAGEHCNFQTGTCEKNCGEVDAPGVCDNDADCAGCIGGQTKCHIPINGGNGTCGPDAAGCEQLGGAGALTLPAPYNQITNTCSTDANCDGVGILYNVGQLLRDTLGTDQILGQPIGDANVEYGMNVCASITLADVSCGVCVPCRVDADCENIDLGSLTGDLFPGVGALVVAFLLDQLYGGEDPLIYMQCQQVAAGYGVCLPCGNPFQDCASDGGGGGSGSCDHPVDEEGTALDPSCDDCAAEVCGFDEFCCTTEWDAVCVEEAAESCGTSDCHDECTEGAAMGAECGTCAGDVCDADPYCCDTAWDATCVSEVDEICGPTCG